MATSVGFPTLTMNNWSPPDKSGYMEQISKKAPALIAPADRILWDTLEHVPVVGYQFDWLTDDLRQLAIPTAPPFETEPTYQTTLFRNRLNNVVEMFREVWSVAEYTEIIAKNGGISSGIMSEIARQITLLTKSMMRGLERTIGSLQSSALEGAAGATASVMAGYFASITAGNTALSKTNTITNYAVGGGQDLSNFLDETTFTDAIRQAYDNGASADLWFLSTSKMMMQIGRGGNFKGRDNVREVVQRGEHKIDTVVERYIAPVGGEVTLQPDRSLGDCGLLIDREQITIGVADELRWFRSDPGSFQNMYGRGRMYVTLLTGNPQASAGWTTSNTPSTAGQ